MTVPAFQNMGTAAGGVGDITPTIGTHQAGDLLLLFVESRVAASAPSGWTTAPGAPLEAGASVLSAFFKLAASGSETNPTVADTGDHQYAVIMCVRGVDQDNPFHMTAGSIFPGSTTAPSFPILHTDIDDCLIVNAYAWFLDGAGPIASGETNASLANLTERHDAGVADGDGGGLLIYTGDKATAGRVAATTCTTSNSNGAFVTYALAPGGADTVSGTVTIDGNAAPNGGTVRILDVDDGRIVATTTISGGAGGYSASVPYSDHNYQAIYDDGSSYGASASDAPS